MVSFACQRNLFQGAGAVKQRQQKHNGTTPLFFCFVQIVLMSTSERNFVFFHLPQPVAFAVKVTLADIFNVVILRLR